MELDWNKVVTEVEFKNLQKHLSELKGHWKLTNWYHSMISDANRSLKVMRPLVSWRNYKTCIKNDQDICRGITLTLHGTIE